jgi:hypothetical protein
MESDKMATLLVTSPPTNSKIANAKLSTNAIKIFLSDFNIHPTQTILNHQFIDYYIVEQFQ